MGDQPGVILAGAIKRVVDGELVVDLDALEPVRQRGNDPGGVGGVLSILAGLGLPTFLSPTLEPRLFLYVACSLRPDRGSTADPVAPRVRRERTTMEASANSSSLTP